MCDLEGYLILEPVATIKLPLHHCFFPFLFSFFGGHQQWVIIWIINNDSNTNMIILIIEANKIQEIKMVWVKIYTH